MFKASIDAYPDVSCDSNLKTEKAKFPETSKVKCHSSVSSPLIGLNLKVPHRERY